MECHFVFALRAVVLCQMSVSESRFTDVGHVIINSMSWIRCHKNFKRRRSKTSNCLARKLSAFIDRWNNLTQASLLLQLWISKTNCSFFDFLSKNVVTAEAACESQETLKSTSGHWNLHCVLISALKSTWNYFVQDWRGLFSCSGYSSVWFWPKEKVSSELNMFT